MLDRAFNELHAIRKMRELIQTWWGLEIGFAYPDGYVIDHEEGILFPSENPFCTASLNSVEGLKRCNRSIQDAVDVLASQIGSRSRAQIVESCHLGFPLLFVPVYRRGTFLGALFTSGFVRQEEVEFRKERVLEETRRFSVLGMSRPGEMFEKCPVLSAREFGQLSDLLELMAGEIAEDPATATALSERALEGGEGGRTIDLKFEDIIGQSPGMQSLFEMIRQVAKADSTVLVTGEDGTGKELVARAIYRQSSRLGGPFVARNCSAFNENLLESELFGHKRGSFTGAAGDRDGVFAQANGGTLFLDEIGDTSGALQVRLLRVLQEGTYVPVGGHEECRSDVRLITATNRPLKEMVRKGTFRKDLYYRLNVIRLRLPPLRERMDDLPFLCDHFLKGLAEKTGRGKKILKRETLGLLMAYDWPGNIRELQSELERIYLLSGKGKVITDAHLSPEVHAGGWVPVPAGKGTLAESVRDVEREIIRKGLIRTQWNKSHLAVELGVSRTTLLKKVREYGLEE